MNRNPIIRKYVKKIRQRLSSRKYSNKKKKLKKKRNPIVIKYVRKIRKRLSNRRYDKKNPNWRRDWVQNNKEKDKESKTKWVKNNKEKINEIKLKRIDINRKYCWLNRGLITDNIDEVYKRYEETTNCDLCNIFLEGNGSAKKCMDHSHTTGLFRNILCLSCNFKRGEDNF